MDDIASLQHSRGECRYHVVWIPKCRRKVMYGQLRKHLGEVLHELARRKECCIHEGHLREDHVHLLIAIPPRYAEAQVIGFLKGKSAIHGTTTSAGTANHSCSPLPSPGEVGTVLEKP